ncbi:MAG TPA: HEAT repeat domain-containing protein [Terriglobia bacterium]|nr:HEAT repeat domain-containing protein [Terriglobia bacterium]
MDNSRLLKSSVMFCCLTLALACGANAQQRQPVAVQTGNLSSLLQTLRENVGLTGNIVLSLETQRKISELGKREPGAVVPVIARELKAARISGRKTADYRIALMSVLEELGPAAETAVTVLTEIVQDEKERNDFVLLKARMALTAIGTPPARQTAKAADQKTVEQWLQKTSPGQVAEAVAQHSYLMRRELRSPHMSEELLEASVAALLAMGQQAAMATPTLLRAWQDPRIGEKLRSLITRTLTAAGVRDVEAESKRVHKQEAAEGGSIDEIIADTRSNTSLVSTMAMTELGAQGPSEKVLDALIGALTEKNNPGQAALVLGGFGAAARRALPALLPYLSDPVAGASVIQALGQIGAGNPEVVAGLRRITADEKNPYRGLAASTLGSLKSASALPELRLALSASDKYTRILAAKAIAALGSEATPAIPELIVLVEDPDLDVRMSAVQALGIIGPPAVAAVTKIEKQLQIPDRRLKESAVAALERIGGTEAEAALERDAHRYFDADLAEYRRLREAGHDADLQRFATALPRARRIQIARTLLKDADAAVRYTGAAVLVTEGLEEETVPTLAAHFLKDTADPTSRLGYGSLMHDASRLSGRMRARICAYFEASLGRYSPQEQESIRKICPQAK